MSVADGTGLKESGRSQDGRSAKRLRSRLWSALCMGVSALIHVVVVLALLALVLVALRWLVTEWMTTECTRVTSC